MMSRSILRTATNADSPGTRSTTRSGSKPGIRPIFASTSTASTKTGKAKMSTPDAAPVAKSKSSKPIGDDVIVISDTDEDSPVRKQSQRVETSQEVELRKDYRKVLFQVSRLQDEAKANKKRAREDELAIKNVTKERDALKVLNTEAEARAAKRQKGHDDAMKKVRELQKQVEEKDLKLQQMAAELEQLKKAPAPANAAPSAIPEGAEESLECIVCMNPLWLPWVLPDCGHTCCQDCLLQHFSRGLQLNPAQLNCPSCRGNVRLRPAVNYSVKNFVEAFRGKPPAEIDQLRAFMEPETLWDGIWPRQRAR